MTPMSSVDAVHDNGTDVWPAVPVDNPDGVDGGVVSGHAAVVTFFEAVLEMLPAASTAATPTV